MSDIVVKLQYPVKISDEQTISELKLGPVSLESLMGMPAFLMGDEGIGPGALIYMIADSAKIPIEYVKRIDMRDFAKIMEKASPFLPILGPTGKS